jgi:uracil-DNA glycosylase
MGAGIPDSVNSATVPSFPALLAEVRACTLCARHLPHGVRPIVQIHPAARLLIAGQAPGRRVHETGIPFNDPSGDRLRTWLGIDRDVFYDEKKVAIVPMGFCYPGTGKSGDLPPRPECSSAWHGKLLPRMKRVEITLAIGSYAVAYHLPDRKESLTGIVRACRFGHDAVLALPHPSPRNLLWLKRNPWFEAECVPLLRKRVAKILKETTV